MSCMLSLGISMICVMSKMDLVKDKKGRLKREVGRCVEMPDRRADPCRYLDPDPELLLEDVNSTTNPKFHALNKAVVGLVSESHCNSC